MPIYEYQCSDCGHKLEALQKMNDDALTDCPQCQKSALVKQISAAAFRLSGSGWYETDFKSGNKKNLAGDAAAKETKPADKPKAADKPATNKTGSAK